MGKRPSNAVLNDSAKKRRSEIKDKQKDVTPAAGIIEAINLKNFMNHAILSFEFKPETNFVTGRNGTGKSALLTGLVVGLGGKASATNRGGQLTGFIQHGKQVCEIMVRMNNKGDDSYKPEIYGDSITVERRLTRKGMSEYKIKSADGEVISRLKSDLARILDHMNIQIENPVVVLNQETSKSFLCSKNPSDRYKFFSKATRLEAMQLGYEEAAKNLNITMTNLRTKESGLPILESQVKELQEKSAALESLDKLRDKVHKKYVELAWSNVQEKEQEYEELHQAVEKMQRSRGKYTKKVNENQEKLNKALAAKQALEDKIKSVATNHSHVEEKLSTLKKTVLALRTTLKNSEASLRQVKTDLKNLEQEKKGIDSRIADMEKKSEEDSSSKLKELQEKLTRQESAKIALQQKMTDSRAQLQKYTRDITNAREEKQELVSNKSELENLVDKARQKIQQMEKSRDNKLARFGRYWPDLRVEIDKLQQAGRFNRPVYGPIGQHIQVTDMQYAMAVETALGATAYSFYVDNFQDRELVEKVKRKICQGQTGPNIICGKFEEQRYNVNPRRAHTNHKLLLDVITIDNDIVFNCIVDQSDPQNVGMILDGREARNLLRTNPPQYMYYAYDSRGDQIYPQTRHTQFRVYSNGKERLSYLSADLSQDIKTETLKLRELSKDLDQSKIAANQISSTISRLHEDSNRQKTVVNQFEASMRTLEGKIYDVKSAISEEEERPRGLDALKSDSEGLSAEIETVQNNVEKSAEEFRTHRSNYEEADKEMKENRKIFNEMRSNVDPLKNELVEADDVIEQAQRVVKHYTDGLDKHEQELQQKETELNQFKTDQVDKVIEEMAGRGLVERIKTRKSSQTITAEITKMKKQLEKEFELRGDADQIRDDLADKSRQLRRVKRDVNVCKTYSSMMDQALQLRHKNMSMIRQYTGSSCKMKFNHFLTTRSYDGRLLFNHDDKTLEIQVESSGGDSQLDARDLKGLSGGEKSFSTLCFMLSLWQNVSSPFRCMDEFDVFMDMVNRKTSMSLILKFAEEHRHNQFILITPQDTSQVDVSDKVHIWRMPDPERGKKRSAPEDEDK